MRLIGNTRLTNAYLDTDINNRSNKIYNQKCKHCLKFNYCKKYKQYKNNAIEWCKKCNKCKNCQIIEKNVKNYTRTNCRNFKINSLIKNLHKLYDCYLEYKIVINKTNIFDCLKCGKRLFLIADYFISSFLAMLEY